MHAHHSEHDPFTDDDLTADVRGRLAIGQYEHDDAEEATDLHVANLHTPSAVLTEVTKVLGLPPADA